MPSCCSRVTDVLQTAMTTHHTVLTCTSKCSAPCPTPTTLPTPHRLTSPPPSPQLWHLVPTQPSHTAHTAHSNVLSGAWASANETWPTTTSGSLLNSTQDNSSACWAPATCNNAPDIWTDPSASLTDAEWNLAMEALAIKHRLLSAQQAQQLPLPDNMIALGATLSAYSTYDLLAQLPDVSAMPHGMHSHLAARQQAAARNAAKAMAAAARPKAKKPTKPAATALAAAAKARRASSAAGTSSAGSGELGEECEEGMDPRHAPGPPSNKLFVGNINSKVTEVELRQLIQGCGTITSVKVRGAKGMRVQLCAMPPAVCLP